MKVLWCPLGLLLILACGEALKCNYCVPARPGGPCYATGVDCGSGIDACVSARLTISPFSYFRRCIRMAECEMMKASSHINARCCNTDRCN